MLSAEGESKVSKKSFFLSSFLGLGLALSLSSCGGGGSSSSSSSNSNTGSGSGSGGTAGPVSVSLATVALSPQDVLAKARYDASLAQASFGAIKALDFLNVLSDLLISPANAQSNSPIKISNSQDITRKLESGALVSIPVTYETDSNGASTSCDLSTGEILVNKIWIANRNTNDFIANLSVMSSVSSDCNATYETSDYFIDGQTDKAYKIEEEILGAVGDVIPAKDSAFNTSDNALLILAGGQVAELEFIEGIATVTQLTADSLRLQDRYWEMAYDGSYLVGFAARDGNPIVVYEKGSTSFELIRVEGNGYPNMFINPAGEFVWKEADNQMTVVDPVSLSLTPYETAAPSPQNVYSHRGRYESWVLGDRCMLWNMADGSWINLYFYPQNATANTGGARLDYVRLSGKYAYCVDSTFDGYARYDLENGVGVGVDLARFGLVANSYKLFEDFAFAEVTNTANSDVEYIEIDFSNGNVTQLGVIKQGSRKVIELQPVG